MARPKAVCPECWLPPEECLGHDDDPSPAVASGLTVLRVPSEAGDDPGEPDPELYHVESGAEGM